MVMSMSTCLMKYSLFKGFTLYNGIERTVSENMRTYKLPGDQESRAVQRYIGDQGSTGGGGGGRGIWMTRGYTGYDGGGGGGEGGVHG